MASRIDEAGHTKAFDYPVAEHWGETEMFSPARTRTDNTSAHNQRATNWAISAPPEDHIPPGPQQGGSSANCLNNYQDLQD